MAYSLNNVTLVATLDGVDYPPRIENGVLIGLTEEEATWHRDARAAYLANKPNRALDNLRNERNAKLKETDFYALSDVTMSSDMQTYRQQLRDLPSNYSTSDSSPLEEDLSNLVWPTKP